MEKSSFTCEDCGKKLELGKDGVCKCGKQLCFDCYEKNHKRKCYEVPTSLRGLKEGV